MSEPPKSPERHAAPRSSGRRYVLAVVGVVIGAVLGGVVLWLATKKPALSPPPLAFKHLPRKTMYVSGSAQSASVVSRTGQRAEEAPVEVYWSAYASICGGTDIIGFLARRKRNAKYGGYAATTLARPENGEYLRCGRALYERFGPSIDFYWTTLPGEALPLYVRMVRLEGLDRLPEHPPSLKKVGDEPKHLDEVHCALGRAETDCTNLSWSVGKIDGQPVWLSGSLRALEAFAQRYDEDGDDSLSGDLAAMKTLYDEIDGGFSRSVGDADGYNRLLSTMLGGGLDLRDDKRVKRFRERLDDDLEAWSMRMDGDPATMATDMTVTFWAKSADEAGDVEDDLEDLLERIERRLDDALDDRDDEQEAERPTDEEAVEYERTDREMSKAAIESSVIEVKGDRVILRLRQEPTEAQARAIERYRRWQRDRLETLVHMVRDLIDDQPLDPDDLGTLDPDLPAAYQRERAP